ncbi:MAG: biotin/lipoyl-binding protein [Lachnospiraceae bacterium]|nr:biotin/lipoyl-binding protein [Lachnospiraceae bacterium]
MKKKISLLLLLGLCVCSACQKQAYKEIPELLEPAAVEMDTARVEYSDMYRVLAYDGEVVPYVEEVAFLTEGVLDEILVTVGDRVKKDQVLAVLDSEALKEQIQDLKEQIADETALGEFADQKALLDIEIAKLELEAMDGGPDKKKAYHAKEVSIERMQADLEQTKQLRELELEKKNELLAMYQEKLAENAIYAPFDGTVVYVRQMNSKDAVTSYVPIVCLADETNLRIQTDYISQTNFAGADRLLARIGDKDYTIQHIPMDESEYISDKLAGAKIRTDFCVEQPDEAVVSGAYAAVMLYYSSLEDVLTIPVNALYQDGTGRYVYLIEEGKRVRRTVKAGMMNEVKVQILEGLEEGDVVYVKE